MPIASATVTDMEDLHRPTYDSVIDAPARRLAAKRSPDRLIKLVSQWRDRMGLGQYAKRNDGLADACQPFVGRSWVAIAQVGSRCSQIIRCIRRYDHGQCVVHILCQIDLARPSKNAFASVPSPARA